MLMGSGRLGDPLEESKRCWRLMLLVKTGHKPDTSGAGDREVGAGIVAGWLLQGDEP